MELARRSGSRRTDVIGMETVRAGFMIGAGRAQEALDRLQATREQLLGQGLFDDVAEQQWLSSAGMALEVLERFDEAQAAISARLSLSQRIYGPEHPMVLDDLRQLARIALRRNQPEEALRLIDLALPRAIDHYGSEHSELASVQQTRALALLRTGDLQQARAAALQASVIRAQVYGEQDWRTLNAQSMLVLIDEAAGDIQAALAGEQALRSAPAWARLPSPTQARLNAIRVFHGGPADGSRCQELARDQAELKATSSRTLLGLYLAACHRQAADPSSAARLLDELPAEDLAGLVADPALARLRAVAAGE